MTLAPLKIWIVWCSDENGADARRIRATDPDIAAELWAEQYDVGDHSIVKGEPATVHVRSTISGGREHVYLVSGEWVAAYTAEEQP